MDVLVDLRERAVVRLRDLDEPSQAQGDGVDILKIDPPGLENAVRQGRAIGARDPVLQQIQARNVVERLAERNRD